MKVSPGCILVAMRDKVTGHASLCIHAFPNPSDPSCFSLAEERPYHSPLTQLQAGECVQYGSDCMPGNNFIILKEQLLLGRL